MRRRDFIAIGGAAIAWPVCSRAQQAKGPTRIGLLPFGSPSNAYDKSLVDAFRSGLRQAGLIEDRDIVLDIVWTSGSDADTDKAVAELIRRGAELLVPTGSTASVAAKRHTSTIPIVFISVGNPVAMGLVENLAHPGGNATGFSDIFSELSAKLVELGRAVNKQDTIDYLWHTAWPDGKNRFQATEQAAQSAGVKLRARGIAESAEIDQAITAMKLDGATMIIVQPSPFTYRRTRSYHRECVPKWCGDDIWFSSSSERWRVDCIRSGLSPDEPAGSVLRQPNSSKAPSRLISLSSCPPRSVCL